MRIRRTHGIFGGLLVALLGIWGGIIPFVGPYFNYAYTPATAWTYNTGRLYLEILPGAGALHGCANQHDPDASQAHECFAMSVVVLALIHAGAEEVLKQGGSPGGVLHHQSDVAD